VIAPPESHSRGFTLLEVLVALIVFAIAALSLLSAQNSQISTDQHLEEKTLAHWVALNQLADMRLQKAFPETGQGETTVKMAGRNWLVRTKVQGTPSNNVRLLIISVAPQSNNGNDSELGKKPDPVTVVTGFLPRAQSNASTTSSS
jgi:general secretion pathway protein I